MKINVKKKEQVEEALQNYQRLARVRTADYSDVTLAVETMENHLDSLGIAKDSRQGVKATYQIGFGGQKPAAYKGTPEATQIEIYRGSDSWFLTNVRRVPAPSITRVFWDNVEEWKEEILAKAERAL